MSINRYVAEDIRRFNALAGPPFFHLLMILVQSSSNGGYYHHDQDCDDLKAELAKMQEAAAINLGKGARMAEGVLKKSEAGDSNKGRAAWLASAADSN